LNSEWEEYSLSDLLDIIGGGTPKTTVSEYWDGNIPWLSVKDFNGDAKKVYITEKTITEKGLENSSTKLLNEGDLIISARGTVGEIAQLGKVMAFNQSCYGLRARKMTTNDFMYYVLRSMLSDIKSKTHGSVFDTITRDTFNILKVNLPPLPEQKRIAEILSSLDDKIELNNKMNKNLEEMAQAIFKQWFVDFEYPDENGNPYKSSGGKMIQSELGEIPNGWSVGRIGKEVEILGGGTPSTKEPAFWNEGKIFWYSPTDLTKAKTLYSLKTEKKITELGLSRSSAKLFPKYSLLMSSRATIGEITINVNEACTNQGFITIIPNDKFSVFFLHNWLKLQIDNIKNLANGSTFLEISKTNFRNLSVIIPKKEILKDFNAHMKPIYKNIENITKQTESLTKTRDSLLPKLMNGEMSVQD
jgi:type I restriction enzyme S subunit